MHAQLIRRSQFITTYGPGAILEGPDGPRIIVTLDQSGILTNHQATDFEITDLRLSQTVLQGAGILRVPSNAELGQPAFNDIYHTDRFPKWSLCIDCRVLYKKTQHDNRACPRCPTKPSTAIAWKKASQQAIRFLQACRLGHLDDVNWIGRINHAQPNCQPDYLRWQGAGGALRNIRIECPNCGEAFNLGQAYSTPWQCGGFYPELGGQARAGAGCSERAEMVQRGAANLRIPEIVTGLTIPPRSTRLHRLLEMSIVRTLLLTGRPTSKADLLQKLQPLVVAQLLSQVVVNEISQYTNEFILQAIDDTVQGSTPSTPATIRLEELKAMSHAATHGTQPIPASTPGCPPQFEVIQNDIRIITGVNGRRLRITPVSRLRVVMVQKGYRRIDPMYQLVDRTYNDGQRNWYPGVELFGEGIFIDTPPDGKNETDTSSLHFNLIGEEAPHWFDAWIDPDSYQQTIMPEERHELHPVFVWWHTLSHRLLTALSVDSGYSSAAVRERVFVDADENTGDATGGVLLYTAQPGGDGTMGGLVALVPQFERVLDAAFRFIDACSNDPLCHDEKFQTGKYNGAACYACCLVSETSCEHRNLRLDRALLLHNIP
jgi:hypothetical protein